MQAARIQHRRTLADCYEQWGETSTLPHLHLRGYPQMSVAAGIFRGRGHFAFNAVRPFSCALLSELLSRSLIRLDVRMVVSLPAVFATSYYASLCSFYHWAMFGRCRS